MPDSTIHSAAPDHNRAHSDLNPMIRQAAERDYAFAIADHLRAIRIHLEDT